MTTTSDYLASLRAMASSLRKRLEENPDFQTLQVIDKAIRDIESLQGTNVVHKPVGRGMRAFATVGPSRADLVHKILIQNGAPMTTARLLNTFEEQGRTIHGRDPATNLASTLSRDDRFRSVAHRGRKAWWLAGKPHPEIDDDEPSLDDMLGKE